jgi:hypothetical protein
MAAASASLQATAAALHGAVSRSRSAAVPPGTPRVPTPSPLRAGALCDYTRRLTGCDLAQWLVRCGWPRRRGGRGAGWRWPAPPLPRMSRRQAPLLAGKLKCNHLLPVILYTLARCHCSWEIIEVVLIGQAVQLNLGVPAVISDYIFVDYTS